MTLRLAPLLAPLLLTACLDKQDQDSPEGELQWYTTCGDPVCGGYSGPTEGVALCTTEVEGASCSPEGARCDPQDDCNALMVCATEDPKAQEGGCPISRAAWKAGIHYLSADERDRVAAELLATRLARYRYTGERADVPERLGFIIEDAPQSPAVRPDGERVDLYGYTSMAVATLQAQQAEIEALEAELAALRARLDQLECGGAASPAPPGGGLPLAGAP